jgi:hypothetical protein
MDVEQQKKRVGFLVQFWPLQCFFKLWDRESRIVSFRNLGIWSRS